MSFWFELHWTDYVVGCIDNGRWYIVLSVKGYWTNPSDPEFLSSYRAGFNDCATKVCKFMENQPRVDSKLREQILVRLAASCSPVTPESVYCPSSLTTPSIYGFQASDHLSCCGVSSPPPSPPSSAFSPFNPGNGALSAVEAGRTSRGCEAIEKLDRNSMDSTSYARPLWRPWISKSQN